MSPCWTLMLLTKNKLSFSDYEKLDNEKISSITFDTSKPQRNKKFNLVFFELEVYKKIIIYIKYYP